MTPTDWRDFRDQGTYAYTVACIVTRGGNPKDIHSFEDAGRPGVEVVYPDPTTSGGAQWAIDFPRNIYDRPSTGFVAWFIGRVNVFSTNLDGGLGRLINHPVFEILVRPEDILLHPHPNGHGPEEGTLLGTVKSYVFLGRTVRLEVQLRNGRLITVAVPKHQAVAGDLAPGRPVALTIGSCQVFPSYGPGEDGKGEALGFGGA